MILKIRLFAVVLIEAIALASAGGGVGATESPGETGPEQMPAGLDHARELRTAFGLNASADVISQSLASPAYSDESWGIPLTPDESAIVSRGVGAQTALFDLAGAAATTPGVAGVYFDGGRLTIAVTDAIGDRRTMLEEMVPTGTDVSFVEGRFPLDELESTATEIGNSREHLADLGIGLKSVFVDPRAGVVSVAVFEGLDLATEYLRGLFGDMVSVHAQEMGQGGLLVCTVNDCGTAGGLTARRAVFGGTITCTTGMIMKANGVKYIATAGHCIAQSGGVGGANWWNGDHTLQWGASSNYDFDPYQNTISQDMGFIEIGATPPAAWNKYFSGIATSIKGHVAVGSQAVGTVVCRNGSTSGWDCGIISGKGTFVLSDGSTLAATIRVDLKSNHGDSGAGFVHDVPKTRQAMGVLSAGDSVPGQDWTFYYTPDTGIGGPLGVWFPTYCVSATC